MFKNIRMSVLLTPLIIFTSLIIIGFIDTKAFNATLKGWFVFLMVNFGWLVSLGMLAFVIFMIVLLFHPIGNIKLGGKDAKPTLTYWQWFSISLCAGIGTGIVFWGAVEPLLFTMEPSPSLGLAPMGNDTVIWAMRTTFLHWSLTPYASYVLFGVILAFACHNLRQPMNVSSGFIFLIGQKAHQPRFASFIDTLTSFALVGGIAGSLGYGLLQLNMGLELVFGIQGGSMGIILICAAIVLTYTLSSVSGLYKGILWLGDKNAMIFLVLMAYFFVCGPTSYICNLLTQSVGSYVANFVESMTVTAPFANSENWPQWWDMYWWLDFLSYGPLMGLFFVRLGYGRTIRQFVVMHWLAPSVFSIIWFGVFGGSVLHGQLVSGFDFYALYKKSGMEVLTLASFDLVPLSIIIKPFMLIIIAISFITLANAMTSTVASLSLKNNKDVDEAPAGIKVCWGLIIGGASLVFTLSGGIDGIKMVKTFAGFPILFVGLFMLAGFVKYFGTEAGKNAIAGLPPRTDTFAGMDPPKAGPVPTTS